MAAPGFVAFATGDGAAVGVHAKADTPADAQADEHAARLIFAHKHRTSARLRFVRFAHGMCGFAAFPAGARVCADGEAPRGAVVTLPSVYLADAEKRLGLPAGGLKIEGEFHACVALGAACADVYLATFTAQDPPFAAVEASGARFIAITDARDCDPLELTLLRHAYEVLLGG